MNNNDYRLANRIISRIADKIFVSFPQSLENFSEQKTVLTGNPLRKLIITPVKDKLKFNNNLPVLYVTGGNQGANTINWRLFKILPQLLDKVNIIHQVGSSTITKDFEKAAKIARELPVNLKSNYQFFSNEIGPKIAQIMQSSDIFVSRAGANIISEILVLGKMAVLIPIPWSSHDEQQRNAEIVADTGLGLILKQYDAMPPTELEQAILLSLENFEANRGFNGQPIAACVSKARSQISPNAAEKFVDELIKL
jgi:UDP-N-acetylglucosamine--N-acetylmuramyl-(pentapeptide) pyrophosphoryl-undecaprenol N-acetylglucosamine transferase